jgi:hypothetical protein
MTAAEYARRQVRWWLLWAVIKARTAISIWKLVMAVVYRTGIMIRLAWMALDVAP